MTRLLTRFMDKVELIPFHACWEWVGCRDHSGYGKLSINRIPQYAHRVSYQLFVGPIPDGMQIMHKCDNPGCSRPSHLCAGTLSDNVLDSARKGRHKGSKKTHCPAGHPYAGAN